MYDALFERLMKALERRNAVAAEALNPGIPSERVRKFLQSSRVIGFLEAVVATYGWRNGSHTSSEFTLKTLSLFPESIYIFMDLDSAIEHRSELQDSLALHPEGAVFRGRFLPMFWDNSTGYLAVDLKSSTNGIVKLEPESEELAQDAYSSFDEFLKDAIRANEENDPLACFKIA
jgi:hypothetical protein